MRKYFLIVGIFIAYILGFGTGIFYQKQEKKVIALPVSAVSPTPSCNHAEISYDNILLTINEYRLSQSLPQLRTTAITTTYADLRQSEIAGLPLTHQSVYSDVIAYAKKNGVEFKAGGELLQDGYKTSCDSLQGFLSSPTHKDILTKRELDTVGISVAGNRIIIELADNPNY